MIDKELSRGNCTITLLQKNRGGIDMQALKPLSIEKIMVSQHAADRWSQKINPGENLEPEDISFLLWYYLENDLIECLGPRG